MDSYDRLAESIRPDSRAWPFPDPAATDESTTLTEPEMDTDIEPETIAAFLTVAEHYLNS